MQAFVKIVTMSPIVMDRPEYTHEYEDVIYGSGCGAIPIDIEICAQFARCMLSLLALDCVLVVWRPNNGIFDEFIDLHRNQLDIFRSLANGWVV